MDIKGIDQIYYGQLQSLDAADRQIFQLDAQQGGQNVEGGKPLAFRLVQPDNADQTRAADNRATRENLFRVLSDAKGLDTEFVNMLRSRLGIAENGTAAGDQALSALDAREVINLAKAKSADLDGMLELGKTLRKVQFDANVKSVLRQTLSREANNPVVIDFLDPSKQPPSLNALTKLCKLATMVKLPNASWESDLAVAYLKGFSATITDEIKLCGSLENPLVDEDKAVLEATKQGQRDYETEKKALEEPKAEEPKVDEENHEPPKVVDEKPEEPKTTRDKKELVPIPCNDDVEGQTDNNQDEYDNILDISNDRESKQEEDTENEIVKGQNETGANQQTIANGSLNEKPEDNEPVIVQGQNKTTGVQDPEETVEIPQGDANEVDEPVVIEPKQKTPEDREFDKLLGAVVRFNAHLITGQKTEGVPQVSANMAKNKVYKAALEQMNAANKFLAEVGKLSVEELVDAWASVGKVGNTDYSKAFSRKSKSPESICWAVKKALGDQVSLSTLSQSIKDSNVKSAVDALLVRVSARANALQELVKKLDGEGDFGGAGVTVAEWMAQNSYEKIDDAEVVALREAVTEDADFNALLRDLEEMSHGGVDAEKKTTTRKDIRDRLATAEKNLRESGKAGSQLANDLLLVLADARKRLGDFKPPRVKETTRKVLLGLREAMFGEVMRKFAETRETAVFKYLVRSNGSVRSLVKVFDRFVNASNAYAKDASSNKLGVLESAMKEVVDLMTVRMTSKISSTRQVLDIGDSIEKASELVTIKVPVDPITKLPPDHVEGLSEDDRRSLILAIENKAVRYVGENAVLYDSRYDMIRGKKTGIPEKASPYEENLIKELLENKKSNDRMLAVLFGDTSKFAQSVRTFVRIGSRLADEEFSKALKNADDPDIIERIIVDQPISEVVALRAIGGADLPADVCETECTDQNLTNMVPLGTDSRITYSLPNGHEETRIFRSEDAAAAADALTYEKRIDDKAYSSRQTLSNLSVAVGETAKRLGVPDAAIQGKLAICKGKFGVLMPDKPGQSSKDVFAAVQEEVNGKNGGSDAAEVKLLANIAKDGYDSTDPEQRKLVGSLTKGYAGMTWIDLVAGVTSRARDKYSIAFENGKATVTGTANHMSFSTYKTGLKTYHLSEANGGLAALNLGLLKLYYQDHDRLREEFRENPLDCPGVSKVLRNRLGNIVGLDIELTDDTPEHIRNALAYGLSLRGGGLLPPFMSRAMSEKLNNAAEMNALKAVWRKTMDKANYDAAVLRLEELQGVLASGKVQVLDNDDAWADADVVKKMQALKGFGKSSVKDGFAMSMAHSTYFSSDFIITKVDGEEVNPKPQTDEPDPAQ